MARRLLARALLRAASARVARSLVRRAHANLLASRSFAETLEPRQLLARATGIDVSHYSGTINWSSVAGAGYAFAYAKATEGASVVDVDMTANLAGGASAGVLMGAYHHAKPDAAADDAANEANWFVQKAGNFIKPGYLRPALDVSEGATGTTGGTLSKAQLSAWVNAFCSTVKSATGVDPVIYTNNDYATTYLDGSVGANHDLWIARWSTAYGTATTTGSPPVGAWGTAGETWDVWQYSNTGTVAGVPGGADLDVFNGDRAALDAFVIGATAPPSFSLGLDFGPTGATVPSGYVNVANTLFSTQGNYQMGWLQSGVTTDSRSAGTAPDVRYRTFAMPALGGVSRSFEVAVPNGSYTVHVVTGSPDQYPNAQKITVEGVTAVNASTSSTQPFLGGTVTVNVTDGRLTLGSDSNGAANTRLDYVDITSNTPAVSTGVQAQVTFGVEARKAVPGYFNDYGQSYGMQRTGETFGWVAVAGGAGASNVGSGFGHGGTSDDRRKQGIATGGKTWEMDVQSGTYWVKLVAGDGSVTSGTYGYDVEGTSGLSLRGTAGADNARWITAEGPVTVSDGRLTITRAGGMANDAIAYVEVMDYLARGRTAVAAPTGVTITSAGDNVTDVRWVDRSDNETGFKVERGTSATGPWTLLKTTYANAGLYEDGSGDDGATYYYRVTAVQRETGASAPVVSNALTTPDVDHRHARSPYNATRVPWDGTSRIEAEDYDVSGAYVAYDDLSDGNAGGYYRGGNGDVGYNAPNARYFVGWTKQGEWNEYTINLAESGRYKFEMSVASPAVGGKFSVLVNGATKWSNLQVPNTGSFTSYQTISTGEQSLSAGTSLVVRVLASADDPTNHDWVADVDWFRLVKAGTPSVPTVSIAATQPSSVGEDSGTPVTFTVTSSGAQGLSEPIEVPLSTAGTGTYNDDYTILTQGAGQFLPTHVTFTPPAGGFTTNDQTYTILVRPVADSNVEPNESVVATLGDAGYGDYQLLSSSSAASATILNDDGSGVVTPPTVSIAASTSSVAEDSRTPVTFTVTLLGAEGGTSAIRVPLSVSGDATSPSDYTVLTQSNGTAIPPSVTFTPVVGVFGAGPETYTFTVTPVADTDVEPDEHVTVSLGTGAAYTLGASASAGLTIVNDDGGTTTPTLPVVSISASAPSVLEDSGLPVTFTVTLTGAQGLSEPINVPLMVFGAATSDDYTVLTLGGGTAIPSSVQFTPPSGGVFGAGPETYTITVRPLADAVSETDEALTLSIGGGSASTYSLGTSIATTSILKDDQSSTDAGSDGAKDSDSDGLLDRWETAHGMDPTNPDEDHDGILDGLDDSDGDGLRNDYESNNGLNILSPDSDGDGTTDKNETDSGADPTDPADGGIEFPSDMYKTYQISAHDGTAVQLGPYGVSAGPGEYNSGSIKLRVGQDYDYYVYWGKHYAARDYGYASLGGVDIVSSDYKTYVSDPFDPLEQNEPAPQYPTTENGKCIVPSIDLEVDSQNIAGWGMPTQSTSNDRIENAYAKFGSIDDGDIDGDGVTDNLDFNGVNGLHIIPATVQVPKNALDAWHAAEVEGFPGTGYFSIASAESDVPLQSSIQVGKVIDGDMVRFWTKDANTSRNTAFFRTSFNYPDPSAESGDLIQNGTGIPFSDLDSTGSFHFFVEITEDFSPRWGATQFPLHLISASISYWSSYSVATFGPKAKGPYRVTSTTNLSSDAVHVGAAYLNAPSR